MTGEELKAFAAKYLSRRPMDHLKVCAVGVDSLSLK